MCGIVGYIGKQRAAQILLNGLDRLEYRGYDSAGIAIKNEKIDIYKSAGQLAKLSGELGGGETIRGNIGIGHTRWATHGVANIANAHPHSSDNENTVVVVHNGIIENYFALKQQLQDYGYEFYSETDSEVIAKIIYFYLQEDNDPLKAIVRFMEVAKGTYAIAILFRDYGDSIYVVRKDSPIVISINNEDAYIASDLQALPFTNEVFFLGDSEIAKIQLGNIVFYNRYLEIIKKERHFIGLNCQIADKGNFKHFMLKEIFEQPKAIMETYNSAVKEIEFVFEKIRTKIGDFKNLSCINIVACGSSYNVGLVIKKVLEKISRYFVNVELASEFRYNKLERADSQDSLVIIISQSGETADSIASLRKAKNLGYMILAVVNVVGSLIELEADYVIHTKAGPEIAVATTKAYSAQLIVGYIFCVRLALEIQTISYSVYLNYLEQIRLISDKVSAVIMEGDRIKELASLYLYNQNNVFVVGRDMDYAICKEGALKLKEISYVFAEAYAAGEFKHGVISLVDKRTVIISVLTQGDILSKTVSNLLEIQSREAQILLIVKEELVQNLQQLKTNMMIILPNIDDLFMPSIACIPLQFLAYYIGIIKGNEIDRPRNLAKCVSVE